MHILIGLLCGALTLITLILAQDTIFEEIVVTVIVLIMVILSIMAVALLVPRPV